MFTKFVVRNVGVLRAFDTPNAPALSKLTLFYGRNGRGKSTLTAMLRAARNGCSATVLGRQSLGNGGAPPTVALLSAAGNINFVGGSWNIKAAPIEVFDTTFITDNVYAGELVDLAQDRGLFSVIIGADGVRLATHLERFNVIAKKCATALKEAEAALATDIPSDMNREEFFALGPNPDYAKRLDAAERSLKAVQQADKIAVLKPVEALKLVTSPANLVEILASTLASIDSSARQRLLDHFKRFGLEKGGEPWIAFGVEHIHDDSCPFCGREDVDAEGLITLYGQIFGDTYKNHLGAISTTASEIDASLGENARLEISRLVDSNTQAAAKWGEYVAFDQALPTVTEAEQLLVDAHKAARALINRKRSSPLERIEAPDEIASMEKAVTSANSIFANYNEALEAMNVLTAKAGASQDTEAQAALARDNVKRRIARHDPGVQTRVDTYVAAKKRDERARNMRTDIQKRLKQANEDAAAHYHDRVNYYLARFGASFTISKITNSMQGNAGQADYGLLIRGQTVARGRGRPSDDVPTFRNTLSAGDKTTLAFAFFIAKLEHDKALGTKLIVIDDPLGSHDSHRRRETVNAIRELCHHGLQVVVLSHDEFLLRDVDRRCVGIPSAAFQIEFDGADQWSAATPVDLDQLCRTGHTKMVDEIIAFVDNRVGDPDYVVLKIRQVLETHYRRSHTAYFKPDQNLGSIVQAIGDEGASHPCHRDLKRLGNCNDATCEKHHGDNALVIAKRGMDPDELMVIASDALELIGARKPSTHASQTSNGSAFITAAPSAVGPAAAAPAPAS